MGARPVVRHRRGCQPLASALTIALAFVAIVTLSVTTAEADHDKPPQARLTVTQVPIPPVTVRADASASVDHDPTPIVNFQFDFGDGSPVVVQTNPVASHTYGAAGGKFTVRVTAIDSANLTGTASASIVVVPENAPVARLSVTQLASPFFTVNANGSTSTDNDPTPIASYRFDFGDGSPAVTTSSSSAQHTYAGQGTYTVILTATDTGGYVSAPASVTINVVPPPENPPVARLTVFQVAPLTAKADGSTSTDTDLTPIASYRFDFGDGSATVVTNPPTATAQHVYANAGTYTVTLTATDTGGLTSVPATASINVQSTQTSGSVAVYAGYYDTHHTDNLKPKPSPWKGSPNVVFVGVTDPGTTNGWDTSALRIDNLSGAPLSGVNATVDMGSHHFALWSANTIPAGQSLILAQTGLENFDGSDTSPAGCYSCNPNDCLTKVSSAIPVVHLTLGATTTNYYDPNQVLNTKGADAAGCPYTGTRNDESETWHQLGTTTPAMAGATSDGTRPLELPLQPEVWLAPPFPNPAGHEVTVRFGMPMAGDVRLALYDIAGRIVETSIEGNLDAGSYVDVVNVSRLKPGAYFITLWTPRRILHQAFVIAR